MPCEIAMRARENAGPHRDFKSLYAGFVIFLSVIAKCFIKPAYGMASHNPKTAYHTNSIENCVVHFTHSCTYLTYCTNFSTAVPE